MKTLFASAAFLTAALTAGAQELALELTPAQTAVQFQLGATLHTVHGTFALKRGTIHVDLASGRASGEIVVDATSAATGNSGRDRKMHGEILESARFPEIVFRPDRLEGKIAPQGASHLALHGLFTIHGADHELTVPVDVETANGQYTSTAVFTIPYVKWGLKNPSTLMLRVSDKVVLTVRTVAAPHT